MRTVCPHTGHSWKQRRRGCPVGAATPRFPPSEHVRVLTSTSRLTVGLRGDFSREEKVRLGSLWIIRTACVFQTGNLNAPKTT